MLIMSAAVIRPQSNIRRYLVAAAVTALAIVC
ncbi:MAG: hypothetical protein ACI9OJ_000502, partial [Myxococcota bacterium]